MKKVSLAAVILSCLTISTQIHAVESISLRNEYGAPIVLAIKIPKTPIIDDRTIDNQSATELGAMENIKRNTRLGSEFYIRATGMTSRYASLQPWINQIINDNNPADIAVITINPSYVKWDLTISYKNY